MIEKKDLKKGAYYLGSGRGSHIALWNGEHFIWPALEWGQAWTLDAGDHYDEGGCFLPMEEIKEKYPSVAQLDWDKERAKKK